MTNSRISKFEIGLLAWTSLNVAIGIWLLFTGELEVFGSGIASMLPLLLGVPAAAYLLWRLLNPTRSVLMFGALFWALQIIRVRFPDSLYAFQLGLSIDFRLTDNPRFVVSINLLAVLVTILFVVAARRRSLPAINSVEP